MGNSLIFEKVARVVHPHRGMEWRSDLEEELGRLPHNVQITMHPLIWCFLKVLLWSPTFPFRSPTSLLYSIEKLELSKESFGIQGLEVGTQSLTVRSR